MILFDYSDAWPVLIDHLHELFPTQHGIIRYLPTGAPKDLDATEVERCAALGIPLVAVWETNGRPDLSGYAGGRRHAERAFGQAEALGFPAGSVIFWTSDSPGPAWGDVRPYAQAWHDYMGEHGHKYVTGAYGHERVWRPAIDEGLALYSWQPETWTDSDSHEGLTLVQMVNSRSTEWGGDSVDENQLLGELPVWVPTSSSPMIVNPSSVVVAGEWIHTAPAGPLPAGAEPTTTTTDNPGDDEMFNCVQGPDETLWLVRSGSKAPLVDVLAREAGGKADEAKALEVLADLATAGQLQQHDGSLWAPIGWEALACIPWHPDYSDLRPA